MAVYFITGKLGAGKTLCSVARMRDYLQAGRRVATNLNVCPDRMLPPASRATISRVPDKPRLSDLQALGAGYEGPYDESRFGLLVLDELGSWMNSRSWNDKERLAVLDWFLHARKWGWDLLLIVQDIEIIDKQLRQTLCEHLVVCRRTDRMAIPLISPLLRLFGIKQVMPRGHVAAVYYGDKETSMKVDRWWYRATDLYDSYETRQVFRDDQIFRSDGSIFDMRASYTVLSPWHTRGRYLSALQLRPGSTALYLFLLLLVLPMLALMAVSSRRSLGDTAMESGVVRRRRLTGLEYRARKALNAYRQIAFVGG